MLLSTKPIEVNDNHSMAITLLWQFCHVSTCNSMYDQQCFHDLMLMNVLVHPLLHRSQVFKLMLAFPEEACYNYMTSSLTCSKWSIIFSTNLCSFLKILINFQRHTLLPLSHQVMFQGSCVIQLQDWINHVSIGWTKYVEVGLEM